MERLAGGERPQVREVLATPTRTASGLAPTIAEARAWDVLDIPPELSDDLDHWIDLQTRSTAEVVTILLSPLPTPTATGGGSGPVARDRVPELSGQRHDEALVISGRENACADVAGADDGRGARRHLPITTVVLTVAPVFVATTHRIHGWIAIGDNGLILLRTQDVATANHPLLGTWTSASLTAGRDINNPGPLWYDLLAPFVKVAGPSVGFAIGVMLANAAAIVGAAVVARRIGGGRAMALVTMLSAGLSWSMGSELLFDAWQPHAMILPFWLVLVLASGIASGDLVLLPWFVGVASVVVQTHLSFVYVVGGIGAAAIVAGLARPSPRATAGHPRHGPLVWSLGVLIVAWCQPVIDQVAGIGNLSALLRSGGSSAERIGLRLSARFVASVVAYPPWWGRPGFTNTIRSTGPIVRRTGVDVAEGNVVSITAAVIGLFGVLGALIVVSIVGIRRPSRPTAAAAGWLAGVAVLASLIAVQLVPIGPLGLSPHTMRWLWPVSAFVLFTVVLECSSGPPARDVATPIAVATTLLITAINLPTSRAGARTARRSHVRSHRRRTDRRAGSLPAVRTGAVRPKHASFRGALQRTGAGHARSQRRRREGRRRRDDPPTR